MYDELVKRLRSHNGWALNETLDEAADAIEELQHSLEIMGDANAKLRDAAWDVTCDPEYRESHFHKKRLG